MTENVIRALIAQGGFAVLALCFGYLGFRGAQMWVADVKAAAERERQLTSRILDLVAQFSAAMASHTERLASLEKQEEGVRQGMHRLLNILTTFEARFWELEKWKSEMLGRPAPPIPHIHKIE